MKDAVVDEVVAKLYGEARRRLLKNEPLRGEAGVSSAIHGLSAGELSALQAVGLSTAPFEAGADDPLMQSIVYYGASPAARYPVPGDSRARVMIGAGSRGVRR